MRGIFDNKLTDWEREEYKSLKQWQKEQGLRITQCERSGITIARIPHGGKFDRVAIAYCNQLDKFNKKRGKFEAMKRLDYRQYMLLPRYIGPELESVLELL